MISLNKCTGSCNVLWPKIWVPKEIKYINFKAWYKRDIIKLEDIDLGDNLID